MSVARKLCVGFLTLLLAAPAWTQTAPSTAPTNSATTVPAMDRVLPELRFDGIAFNEVISFLQDVTGMNIAVVREGDLPAGYPSVTVHLKDVTPTQFFAFLKTAYGISVDEVEGPKGSVYVVKVPFNQTTADAIGRHPDDQSVQQIYRLRDIIANLAAGKQGADAQKQALNDALSLLQASLAMTPGTPMLKVHEPTQTLIFKGSREQQVVLEDALDALRPTDDEREKQSAAELNSALLQVANQNQMIQALEQQISERRKAEQQPTTQPQKD